MARLCLPCASLRTSSLSILFRSPTLSRTAAISFCSSSEFADSVTKDDSKRSPLKPGLYLVGTPIGNLEDITLRAIRVLRSANVILSEDTRHSGKLLQYYNIKAQLLSYHKFNEAQREQAVLTRLKQGEIVALISDAGTPGISDPGTQLAKMCAKENIDVIPIPGACAVVSALSASGLETDEFTFVGFLPKHSGTRKERLMVSANETRTQSQKSSLGTRHLHIWFLNPACIIAFAMNITIRFHNSINFSPASNVSVDSTFSREW